MGSLDDELVCLEAIYRAEQLYESAIRDSDGSPEWLGMDLGQDGQSFNFCVIGSSLYSGAAGIAIAFARISISRQIQKGELWRERAWSCLERLPLFKDSHNNIRLLQYVRDENLGIGGIGGLLLSIQLLQKAGIIQALPLEGLLIDQIRQQRLMTDMNLDLIGGVSGLIGPLLRSNHPKAVELATMCGERLLDTQSSEGAWSTLRSCRPLTGFSHGAAGIAAALVSLAKLTDDLRFAQAAQRALAYERSVYVESQRNWPDFRGTRQARSFMMSWCHGAPGILLSRLILQSVGTDDESLQKELDAARKSSIAAIEHFLSIGYVSNCNLCCGAFGVTSLLRLDARLNNRSLPDCVPSIERQMINAALELGEFNYFSVINGTLSMPGLFTGKAGTIMALMEISDGLCWLAPVLSAGLLPWENEQ
jgi:lantibiotic modifying enzyme